MRLLRRVDRILAVLCEGDAPRAIVAHLARLARQGLELSRPRSGLGVVGALVRSAHAERKSTAV